MPDHLREVAREIAVEVLHAHIAAALADLDRLQEVHERRELDIYPAPAEPEYACATCGTTAEYPVAWPCETYQAATRIRRTLTGEDADHA